MDESIERIHDRAVRSSSHQSSIDWMRIDERLSWLERFGAAIDRHCDDLVALIRDETGKCSWEALASEILPLRASIQWHLRHAPSVLASQRIPGKPWWLLGQSHRVVRVPVGRVAIIATWNYPVQLLGIQIVQSVIAGNTTVVKPSEHAPRSQGLLLRIAAQDIGAGALTRTAATRVAGERLLDSERFDHVIFTGSTEVGRSVARRAAETLTPTTLELSGCDSAFVLAGADLSLAAKSIWQAVVLNAGQTCMAPRRIIVESAVYRAFLAHLAPLVAGAKPMRLISVAAAERMDACVQSAIAQGGHSLSGVAESAVADRVRPIAVFDCPLTCDLAVGNHFSPAVAIVRAEDLTSASAIHCSYAKHLCVSVYASRSQTNQLAADCAFIAQLRAGSVTFNDSIIPTAHPGASISGTGESGWGSTRGTAGLLALTRPVTVSRTNRWIRIPVGEPDPGAQRFLARILGVPMSRKAGSKG